MSSSPGEFTLIAKIVNAIHLPSTAVNPHCKLKIKGARDAFITTRAKNSPPVWNEEFTFRGSGLLSSTFKVALYGMNAKVGSLELPIGTIESGVVRGYPLAGGVLLFIRFCLITDKNTVHVPDHVTKSHETACKKIYHMEIPPPFSNVCHPHSLFYPPPK